MSRGLGLRAILTLKCASASELVSRQLDEPLSRVERLALWGHLLACNSCRRFRRQIGWIRSASRRLDNGSPDLADHDQDRERDPDDALSPEARVRIARAIDEARRERS